MNAVDPDQKRRMIENAKQEVKFIRQSSDSHKIRTFLDAVKAGMDDGWLNSYEEIGSSEAEINYFKAVASLD